MSDQRATDLQDLSIDRSVQPKSRWRTLLWFGLIAILGGTSYVGYFYFWVDETLAVETALAVSANRESRTDSVLDANGYVIARRQASVSSKVPGKVTSVLIEEGMFVEEGQLLATLDDAVNRAQLELTESQVQATVAQVEELHVRLKQAIVDLDRRRKLAQQALVSDSEVETLELEVESLNSLINTGNENILVAKKSLALQQQYLSDMEIRAPFAGVVVSKTAQPGEMIAPVAGGGGFTRTGICTIVDMDSLEVEVDVNEASINKVQPGQQVTVQLKAYADVRMPAEVLAIIPTADRARATFKVRVGFKQRDERVLPDMAVQVAFLPEGEIAKLIEVPSGVLIPRSAIDRRSGATQVWVVKDGIVGVRSIQIGKETDENVQVVNGLKSGERVVTGLVPRVLEQLNNGLSVSTI